MTTTAIGVAAARNTTGARTARVAIHAEYSNSAVVARTAIWRAVNCPMMRSLRSTSAGMRTIVLIDVFLLGERAARADAPVDLASANAADARPDALVQVVVVGSMVAVQV